MFEHFTIEEINLMCIFDTSSRKSLIRDLVTAIHGFEEPEMKEIAENVLYKLGSMSDGDFAELDLYPAFEDYDGQED